ncbi:hypothetical protein DFQ26_006427 [Actinomortierella ambigua]|nr:hypothetical protein DFQ26_006427 [Actinomortierella ambigua]
MTTLNQVLRLVIRDDQVFVARVVKLLLQMQQTVTDLENEVFILVHKALLTGSMWDEKPVPIDLSNLLPPGSPPPSELRNIEATPLPGGLQ